MDGARINRMWSVSWAVNRQMIGTKRWVSTRSAVIKTRASQATSVRKLFAQGVRHMSMQNQVADWPCASGLRRKYGYSRINRKLNSAVGFENWSIAYWCRWRWNIQRTITAFCDSSTNPEEGGSRLLDDASGFGNSIVTDSSVWQAASLVIPNNRHR